MVVGCQGDMTSPVIFSTSKMAAHPHETLCNLSEFDVIRRNPPENMNLFMIITAVIVMVAVAWGIEVNSIDELKKLQKDGNVDSFTIGEIKIGEGATEHIEL
ncbi:hypothetical protein GE061_016267 [Apolygus lucorum]|uniref:Uncharacterized protein n=1 Tax=Apolygus lucorum TaxID=248454 RepID=A0A6A4JRE7_APOLU|nr:hypothetical protein GE061_016267 [Apolygus lucorum]